jgi:hypothetical protein
MTSIKNVLFAALCGLCITAFLSRPAAAQATISFAQLNGTVQDPSNKVIVGAAITVRNTGTNRPYSATSNASGWYVVPNLPPGPYELSVSYTGFGLYKSSIELRVGQTATVNITLILAGTEQQIIVTDVTPRIEPGRTELSQVINTEQISLLPVSGRLFTDFALLTPNVAAGRTSLGTTMTEFEVTQISFGGQRSFSNIITVDGADFTNASTGVQRATPPQESVAEFRVVNNSFGTEYGRALGGIVNVVTKSGANDLHGSVYEYLQNSATNARSLLQPKSAPFALRQNQFGGTLGGALKKDRTFFFVNYEGVRRGEAPPLPTNFWSNLSKINQAKRYMGIPAEDDGVLKTKNNDYGFARVDHQLTEKHNLAVRYSIEDARDLNQLVGNTMDGGGIGAPSAGRNIFIRDQALVSTLNSVLSQKLVNTFLFQYSRRHYNFPGSTGEPNLDISNDLMFGHAYAVFDAINETRLQFSDELAWVPGNHAFKFGIDANHIRGYEKNPFFMPGRFVFPNLNCMVDFANYVDINGQAAGGNPLPLVAGLPPCPALGIPQEYHGVPIMFFGVALPRELGPGANQYHDGYVPVGPFEGGPVDHTWPNAYPRSWSDNLDYRLNHGYYGFYAQDRWKLSNKIAFNYGLRWEFETGLGKHIDSYYGAIQPRLGLAYSPDNKTVIRAGAGLFFDRNNMTFFLAPGNQKTIPGYLPGFKLPMVREGAEEGGWQLNQVVSRSSAPSASADRAKSILLTGEYPPIYLSGGCPPACGVGAGGMDRHDSKLPYATQASLEIDRDLGKGLTASAAYLFVGSHRLVRGNDLNAACPIGTSKPDNPSWAQGWLNPDGSHSPCVGTPQIFFDGKPHFNGLANTAAGLLDYNDGSVNASHHGLTLQATGKFGGYFSFNSNYTFSKTIDDGNFTTFISFPQNNLDRNSERGLSNQDVRHRFVTNFIAIIPDRGSVLLRNWVLSSIISIQSGRPFTIYVGYDANGDTNPVTDRVGLVARNTYIGDAMRTWDLRLSRFIQATEKMRLYLTVDAFNLLNRPNVDEVSTVYSAPVFTGDVPQQYKDGVGSPNNPAFGMPRSMLNPRQLQFALKLTF